MGFAQNKEHDIQINCFETIVQLPPTPVTLSIVEHLPIGRDYHIATSQISPPINYNIVTCGSISIIL